MCFVWISEQTAIIFLYSINWLVFITKTDCLLRGTDWMFTVYVHAGVNIKRLFCSVCTLCIISESEFAGSEQLFYTSSSSGQTFTLTDTWRMWRHCLQDINHNTHTEYGTLKMGFWFSSCLRKWCDGYCAVRTGRWRGVFWTLCSWFGNIRHVGFHFLYIYQEVFSVARKVSDVLPEVCVGLLKSTYYFVQLNS